MTESHSAPLVVRPHRIRRFLLPVAVAIVVLFVVGGLRLRDSVTGVHFLTSDQVAVIGLGLLIAAGLLLFLRPMVRACAEMVEVRNLGGIREVPWADVRAVSFPDGAPWARLELDADEYIPVMAIQATDGQRAVVAIRELRALHRDATMP
ncbi:MAG: PH domain-containing protein [Sciscionella sp.]